MKKNQKKDNEFKKIKVQLVFLIFYFSFVCLLNLLMYLIFNPFIKYGIGFSFLFLTIGIFFLIKIFFETRKIFSIQEDENNYNSGKVKIVENFNKFIYPNTYINEKLNGLRIVSNIYPAKNKTACGDIFEIIKNDNKKYVVIGDVIGHGIISGFIMVIIKTIIKTLLLHNKRPVEIINFINNFLINNLDENLERKYVMLSILEINEKSFTIYGSNESVFLIKNNNKVHKITTHNLGSILGLNSDIHDIIKYKTFSLEKNDKIILYTDGLTEEHPDNLKYEFCSKTLKNIIKNSKNKSIDKIIQKITKKFFKSVKNSNSDDIIIAVIEKIK